MLLFKIRLAALAIVDDGFGFDSVESKGRKNFSNVLGGDGGLKSRGSAAEAKSSSRSRPSSIF